MRHFSELTFLFVCLSCILENCTDNMGPWCWFQEVTNMPYSKIIVHVCSIVLHISQTQKKKLFLISGDPNSAKTSRKNSREKLQVKQPILQRTKKSLQVDHLKFRSKSWQPFLGKKTIQTHFSVQKFGIALTCSQ